MTTSEELNAAALSVAHLLVTDETQLSGHNAARSPTWQALCLPPR
jgi:hypothetical protein